jgi:four helix bundle protein
MHNFKKLDIWNKSVELVADTYRLVNTFPQIERFGLISQMQRAAVSIPTNIAEGSAKSSNKDFVRFLEISLGSAYELETELLVSFKLSYIESEMYEQFQQKLSELQRMINGFKDTLYQ